MRLQPEIVMPTVLRYLLLQVPGWLVVVMVLAGLVQWTGVSRQLAGALFVLVLLKDLVIYPFVRSAYDGRAHTGAERMVGVVGRARERLAPSGYVLVQGELWRARTAAGVDSIDAGAAVQVAGVDGSVLVVTVAVNDA